MGRQHQGMDRPGVRQVPEGCAEQGKMEETGFEIIYGAPTTLAVKGIDGDDDELPNAQTTHSSCRLIETMVVASPTGRRYYARLCRRFPQP